ERPRTRFVKGKAQGVLPHGNCFGLIFRAGKRIEIHATSFPAYLKQPGKDPFAPISFQEYSDTNAIRVVGLFRVDASR
ncbi:MAG: hypothetical protein D6820_05085, partial [Lentisphaerae bacterium]